MLKLVEGFGGLVRDDFLGVNLQSRKESLVEQATFLRPGLDIGGLDVVRHGQSQRKGLEDVLVLDAQAVDALLGGGPLTPYPGLLLGEQCLAYLIGVVSLQQLPLLLVEAGQRRFGLGDLLGGEDSGGLNVRRHARTQGVALLISQFLGGVVLLNGDLDCLDAVGALGAVAVLATAADEVFVLAAVTFGAVVDQASATLAAVDAAAQVVEVPPGTFAADALGRQQFLDLLERRFVN